MKKLELVVAADKDPRDNYKHIQFKASGLVYATNGYVAAKCPVSEVLGAPFEQGTEDFYVLGKDWGRFKFSTATRFTLSEDRLIGFNDKQEELGSIKVLFEPKFIARVGRYPEIDKYLPREDAPLVDIPKLGLNVDLLSTVSKALGFKTVQLSFRGAHTIVQVNSGNIESAGSVGYVMPLAIPK